MELPHSLDELAQIASAAPQPFHPAAACKPGPISDRIPAIDFSNAE